MVETASGLGAFIPILLSLSFWVFLSPISLSLSIEEEEEEEEMGSSREKTEGSRRWGFCNDGDLGGNF